MSWSLVKLGDVAPAKPSKHVFSTSDEVWTLNLDQVEADTGKVLGKVMAPVSEAGTSTHGFDERHVLYSKLRPYLNKVALPDERGLATTELVPMLPDPLRLDRKYLVYYLRSKNFVDWVSSQVAGAKMPRVSMHLFWQHEIPLPPLPEQKRIAAILDKADAIRRKRQQAIQLADDFLRAVFLDMFGDPVTNPKGWPAVELGNLIVKGPTNGLYKHSSEYGSGTRILRIDGFYSGRLVGQEKMKRVRLSSQEIERFKLEERSVVINRVNSRDYLGKSAFISGMNEDTVFESNMMNFSVDESVVNPVFLVEFLGSSYVKKQILSSAKDAVNQSSINQQDVRSLKILLPPLALQESFEGFVSKRQALAKRVSVWQGVADETCLSITQQAFSGEL